MIPGRNEQIVMYDKFLPQRFLQIDTVDFLFDYINFIKLLFRNV